MINRTTAIEFAKWYKEHSGNVYIEDGEMLNYFLSTIHNSLPPQTNTVIDEQELRRQQQTFEM